MSSLQKQSQKCISLCGVNIDNLSRARVLAHVRDVMQKSAGDATAFLRIATVNPDFVLRARTDAQFRDVVNKADMRLADGVGISVVSALLGRRVQRYPGAGLFFDLLAHAEKEKWHVHFLCWDGGLSRWVDVKSAVAKQYPHLCCSGENVEVSSKQRRVSSLREEMFPYNDVLAEVSPHNCAQKTTPILYFANFGAPEQEYFLEGLRAQGARGVAVGVGGAFDFLTGSVHRAPVWVQRVGLEWLWRTVHQPKRLGKMVSSVIVFPVVTLWEKLSKK